MTSTWMKLSAPRRELEALQAAIKARRHSSLLLGRSYLRLEELLAPEVKKPTSRPKRYAELRIPELQGWIRLQPCVMWDLMRISLPGRISCAGKIQCCHLQRRATGGPDRDNCYPLCRAHHDQEHTMGLWSFQQLYGLDLKKLAIGYTARWQHQGGV